MMSRGKTLLVGAGAEYAAPFSLPSGKQFVFDTCYYSNSSLYGALEEFYRGRLSNSDNSSESKAPAKYQPLFLYTPQNAEFRKLANYVLENCQGSVLFTQLKKYVKKGDDDATVSALDSDGLAHLFAKLIKRSDDDEDTNELREIAIGGIPEDAYYGIIESYFSSLVNPKRRSQSFWRLINYYWSAFFTVAEPLIRKVYGEDCLFKKKGLYECTLANLPDVVEAITDRNLYSTDEVAPSYYGRFRDRFANVLTTNYTGLSELLFSNPTDARRCIYLSGALWQFEHLDSLTSFEIDGHSADKTFIETEFVFPFLMTQAPIKPIIDTRQIEAYSKAIDALRRTDLLVVLGYSFCESDYHIAALVRDYMLQPGSRLIYFDYSKEKKQSDIARLLRLSSTGDYDIQVLHPDEEGLKQLDYTLSM